MSAVPIVIVGTMKDNDSGEEKSVTITGLAGLQGYSPGHPLPGQPPGIWGPTDPRPGWGLPGQPPGIWGPNDPRPGWGLPGAPPGIWGGGNEPFPGWGLPKPPENGGGEPPEVLFDWKVGWSAETGWVVVAIPKFDTPVPSK